MSIVESPALLAFVKKHLRISADSSVMDDEIGGLIAAAQADMSMRGIDVQAAFPATAVTVGDMKPLAVRAVVYYCKANFGVAIDLSESTQYWARYEGITQSMSHATEYRLAPAATEGG